MRIIRPQDLEVLATPPAGISSYACEFSLHVRIAGIVMEMRFDDASMCDRFARRYRDHVIARTAPDMTFFCVRHDGAYYFWSNAIQTAWRWPGELPPHAVTLMIDATAMASLVRSDATLLSFHAGAVACNGFAAAIVGESTAGKTTTTIACARRGMTPYSDERLLLRDGMVLPFMRAFNVRPGGRALLQSDDASDEFAIAMRREPADADWTDVSLFEVMPRLRKPQPAPLCAVFVLQPAAGEASVREIDPRHATRSLMTCADCAAQSLLERAARTMGMLRTTTVYNLTLGTPAETAALIESTIREHAARAA